MTDGSVELNGSTKAASPSRETRVSPVRSAICPTCHVEIGERDYPAAWPWDSTCACPDPQPAPLYPCPTCQSTTHEICTPGEAWFRKLQKERDLALRG